LENTIHASVFKTLKDSTNVRFNSLSTCTRIWFVLRNTRVANQQDCDN